MKKYFEAILAIYPEFNEASVEVLDHGQNNKILILNERVIFRFPKTEINRIALKVEYDSLLILKEKVSFKVPNFKYHHFGDALIDNFVGYEMIQGITLSKEVFDQKDPSALGMQLSDILKELHQPYLKTLFENRVKVVDTYMEYKDMYDRIEKKLFPYMRADAIAATKLNFEHILEALSDVSFESALIHGDFGPTNIIVDPDNSTINGIIDFGEIHIGDPAGDISALIGPFGYGETFILDYFSNYPEAKEMVKRAKLYTKTFALQEALYGIENDDNDAFQAGIKYFV